MINKIINHLFSQKIFIWNHEFQSAKGHFVWHWRGKVEYKHLAMSLFRDKIIETVVSSLPNLKKKFGLV